MRSNSLIETLYATQGAGRHVCPKCAGGSDSEKCLSLRMDDAGQLHWRCFRAMCDFAGGPRGMTSLFTTKKVEPRHYTRPTKALTAPQALLLHDKFGLKADEVGGYNELDDRFILPVYGPVGHNLRGHVAYSLSGAKPKTLTYNAKPEEPFVHYSDGYAGGLVVVEDWFSAEKVSTTGRARGVALMGTHLSQDMVTEIATLAASVDDKTWLALDRDAYEKSVGYLLRYKEQFPRGLYVWKLARDLKYETTERITEALVDGKTNFIGGNGKQGQL